MRKFLFQLADLRYLSRGLRAYGARRTIDVREKFSIVIRWTHPFKYRERRKAISNLFNIQDNIPERTGILCLNNLGLNISDVLDQARSIMETREFIEGKSENSDQHLYVHSLQTTLKYGDPILSFALDHTLIQIIAKYIGVIPVIEGIGLWYSSNKIMKDGSSQFFHLDGQDRRTLQVFIHLDEVTEENGPLTAVVAEASEVVARSLQYRKVYGTKRLADEQVLNLIDKERDVRALVGPAGTAHIVDTDRCFHFGSRVGKQSRMMLVFQYYSPFAFVLPRHWERVLPFASMGKSPEFSELEQLVMGNH